MWGLIVLFQVYVLDITAQKRRVCGQYHAGGPEADVGRRHGRPEEADNADNALASRGAHRHAFAMFVSTEADAGAPSP
jgi:hypothetical protein